jgi:hypothetical protein
MTDDSGNLSVDFLAGFTIFMIAFIWVAAMIPGMMIGLQSRTIDCDAVAYRTGVILAEDQGWPALPSWESFGDLQKSDVIRFGLAVSGDTPNILAQEKVSRFYATTAFTYPEDYRQRVIFGDYPYRFNISILDIGKNQIQSVGDIVPDSYGNIRRIVKIKGASNATIGRSHFAAHNFTNLDAVTMHEFSILINNTKLLGDITDPKYQIDPTRDQVTINITGLRSTINHPDPDLVTITLTDIKIFGYKSDAAPLEPVILPKSNYPYIDDSSVRAAAFPVEVENDITLLFNPRDKFFYNLQGLYQKIYVNLTFGLDAQSTFLNNSFAPPFDYNYHPDNVTQPYLREAVLEVAVW